MPIKSYTVGPGTLTVGSGPLAVSAQFTSATLEVAENVTSTDPIPVLSGEDLPGDETVTFTYTLTGNVFQDLAAAGLVDWSWTNKGTEQPFTFVPNTAEGRQVSGVLKPVPISIGGEAKTRGRSDIAWRCVGEPALGNVGP